MHDHVADVLSGATPFVFLDVAPVEAPLLLPGSFNPLHRGHCGLLRVAETFTGRTGFFELSVLNVDKPPLSEEELTSRLNGLQGERVVVTRAPTFLEKAHLFPGACFVVGYDTVIRLLHPDYHADIPAMLGAFDALKVQFIVAGRLMNGCFHGAMQLEIPSGFEHLFTLFPEKIFREDISSTVLRKA